MAIRYVRFEDKRVSKKWYVVLRHMRRAGVDFKLNSGHRTMREQWKLFRQNMEWNGRRWVPKPGRPLTAYPSPTAPHVRSGYAHHALDVDGAKHIIWHLRQKHGVTAERTVPGEEWHIELSRKELNKVWREMS